MSIVLPLLMLARRSASCITVRVRRPRKSIFRSPSSSSVVIVNCVVTEPSDPRDNGTNSSIARWPITTPAACMDVCLGRPSSLLDISISSFTCSSSWYSFLNSGFIFRALSNVIFSSVGTIFAMLSTNAYGRSMTRPTSRMTPRAAIVPKVTICTTRSAPYFLPT